MKGAALLMVAVAATTAAGCATAPALMPGGSSGAPVPVAGYDWFFHQDGNSARLAYGLRESDDLRLGLDCRRGTGRLELSAHGVEGQSDIHLESGGETERYRAASEPSEVGEGVFLTAQAATADPVFLRFRRIGWLAVWTGDRRDAYAPQPPTAANIERFFAFCSAQPAV